MKIFTTYSLAKGPRKMPRIWLSKEEKVAHAWVAACDAGDRLLLIVQSAKDSKLVMQVTCAWWK